jgi:hypothetical protein
MGASQRFFWPTLAILAVIFAFAAGSYYGAAALRHEPASPTATIASCVDVQSRAYSQVSIEVRKELIAFCYQQISTQYVLDDFPMRQSIFSSQQFTGLVLLWIVVGITVSGVILAAIQLLATYKLAVTRNTPVGEAGELVLAADKIALKSSVTGLFILIISFAFFLTYMNFMANIRAVNGNLPPTPTYSTPRLPDGSSEQSGPR